ncbi:uncharacterized protein LOC127708907 isoform X2 [Mytilus californianus]|uniref:uncharacterized protein LOC127708907 isoform X2 n=1 Tax=Mytilus californianus TaxID=6549 RepID=UPI002247C039|nr:uncharacterized protein LOC127708907 isoform X2 [Mytilus californianus]
MSICITICKSERPPGEREMQTWYDSASMCRLVTNENPPFLDNFEGCVGRMYLNTSWMTYEGCFFLTKRINKNITLKENSPALCSLLCTTYQYLGLKEQLCVCLNKTDIEEGGFQGVVTTTDCIACCTSTDPWRTCGSSSDTYYSIYEHNLEPYGIQDTFNSCIKKTKNECSEDGSIVHSCIIAKKSCVDRTEDFCENQQDADSTVNNCRTDMNDSTCPNIEAAHNDSSLSSYWLTFYKSTISVWLDESIAMRILDRNLSCDLGISSIQNHSYVFVTNSNGVKLQSRQCNSSQSKIAYTGLDRYFSLFFQKQNCDTEKTTNGDISTITDYMNKEESSKNYEQKFPTDSGNNTTTANSTISEENDDEIFLIQMGFILGSCAMVMLIAVLACCIRITRRSVENIVIAMEGPPQHTIPIAALAENYSTPKDKASTCNEIEGPRSCATASCRNTNYQKTENSEYQHLDFTLRSETTPRFADNNEYHHGRANVISVFEQPWDTATSKVNKLFSQISKSVVQKGQNMRKYLIKRRASGSDSVELKCRASNYCDAWKTQLNNQQFVFDSEEENQSNISINVENSSVDSNKDESEFRKTDSAFPVLPFSERINVKSTHIYDEPDDRRLSLRERLLHMLSIKTHKMSFGIELDLRGSRSNSKICSLATPIDEIDESDA